MSHLPTAFPPVPISSLNQPYLWICLPPEGGRELDVTPLHFADVVGSGVHLGRQVKDIDSIFGHYFKGEQRQPSDTGSRDNHQPPTPPQTPLPWWPIQASELSKLNKIPEWPLWRQSASPLKAKQILQGHFPLPNLQVMGHGGLY